MNSFQIIRRTPLLLTILVLTLTSPTLYPVVIATEQFNYTNGTSLAGQSGGTGWGSNNWTWNNTGGTFNVMNGVATTNPTSGTTGMYRDINLFSQGETVYVAYQIRIDAGTRYGGLSLFSSSTEEIFTGQGTSLPEWRLQSNSPLATADSGVTVERGVTVDWTLLLVKIERNYSSTLDRLSIYVNPSLDSPLGTANGVIQGQDFFTNLNRIVIWSGYQSSPATTTQASFDSLIAATTWGDIQNFYAIPEPATTALLLGGLLLLMRRRFPRKETKSFPCP